MVCVPEATHRILSKKSGSQAPVLVSLTGEDITGGVLQNELSRTGMITDGLISIPGEVSAVFNMVCSKFREDFSSVWLIWISSNRWKARRQVFPPPHFNRADRPTRIGHRSTFLARI